MLFEGAYGGFFAPTTIGTIEKFQIRRYAKNTTNPASATPYNVSDEVTWDAVKTFYTINLKEANS